METVRVPTALVVLIVDTKPTSKSRVGSAATFRNRVGDTMRSICDVDNFGDRQLRPRR